MIDNTLASMAVVEDKATPPLKPIEIIIYIDKTQVKARVNKHTTDLDPCVS